MTRGGRRSTSPWRNARARYSFANFFIAVRASAGSPLLLTRSLTAALTAVNPDLNASHSGGYRIK